MGLFKKKKKKEINPSKIYSPVGKFAHWAKKNPMRHTISLLLGQRLQISLGDKKNHW